jgi:beta-galactosidase
MDSEWVRLDGNYFSANGKRLFILGTHYVPAVEALQWPYEWNPEQWDSDFRLIHDMGLNFVRFDLFWAWFEPRPGQYNEEAFAQMDEIIRLARKYALYLNPTFFIGGEVGDAYWDVPWRAGRHPHSDPEMLRLQVEHVKEFARRYEDEPIILAWDLTDEPPYWIVAQETSDSMAANWTRALVAAIRQFDRRHPILVGTSSQEISRGPFRADIIAEDVDFLSVHPYPFYQPEYYLDSLLSMRVTYAAAFETMLARGAGKAVMVQEFGASSAQFTPERIGRYYNAMMYSALGCGAHGLVAWCFTDADEATWSRVPYLLSPHETQFGITNADKQDRPAAVEMRELSRVLSQMEFDGLTLPPQQAGIIVPHEFAHGADHSRYGISEPNLSRYVSSEGAWTEKRERRSGVTLPVSSWLSAFVLARQAHLEVGFPREYTAWEDVPLILMPSPLTSTSLTFNHVHTTFWRRAQRYVEAGGTLYASLSGDTAIPEMQDLFGASLEDRIFPEGAVEIEMIQDFYGLEKGQRFRYQAGLSPADAGYLLHVTGGEIIAVDRKGNPAMVAHSLGRGRTLVSAYPVEHYLAQTPGAFDGEEAAWTLYLALKKLAGLESLFDCEDPRVELGLLPRGGEGYLVAVNHCLEPIRTALTSSLSLEEVRELTPGGARRLPHDEHLWEIGLKGFTGTVFHWRAKDSG